MLSRRAVLGLAVATVTTGCTSLWVRCEWGFTVRATPADEMDVHVTDLVPAERELVARAIEDGNATATTIRGSPLVDETVVSHEGMYYAVRIVGESSEQIPALRLDMHPRRDDESLGDVPVVEYDSLPEVDRQVVDRIVNGSRWRPHRGLADDYSMGDVPWPYPNGTDDSRIATEETLWLQYGEETHFVHVRSADTMEQTTYRYEVTRLGTTLEAVRQYRIPEDVPRLDALPDDQRAIMDQAIEDEYETCEAEPLALRSFIDRLGPDVHGRPEHIVEYQDTVYEVSARGWGRS